MGKVFPDKTGKRAAKSQKPDQIQDQERGTSESPNESQGPLDDFPHRG